MKKIFFFGCVFLFFITNGNNYDTSAVISEVIQHYFLQSEQDINVATLSGGHSNACMLLTVKDKKYVLRIKEANNSTADLKRELFAMQEAAHLRIAPDLLYITQKQDAVLMPYIAQNTLSYEESRKIEIITNIANSIRAFHTTSINPYCTQSCTESALELCSVIAGNVDFKDFLSEAAQLVQFYEHELATKQRPKVNVHGDLNPRNIFAVRDRVTIIDWEYSGVEDPFTDLSYFSIRSDFSTQEELLLLEKYLQHAPTCDEVESYFLAKKLNYAQLVIFFFNFALKFGNWDVTAPLYPWSHYVRLFFDAENDATAHGQYYCDIARYCLDRARESK